MLHPALYNLGRACHGHEGRRRHGHGARLRVTFLPLVLALLTLLLAPVLTPDPAEAAVPPLVHYQAYLTDDGGVPLTGPLDLEFAIYDSSAAGALLWSEAFPATTVDEGVASVALGSSVPLDASIFASANCWLETSVGGTPLAPRRPFLSVPYALRAQVAETALTGGGDGAWVVDGANVYRPDGNVGVGTTAPAERFHAVSPLFARLRLERTGGTTVQTDASLTSGSVGTITAHPFRIVTGNAVRMTADTDGEIGIGTVTPDGKLDVRATGGQDLLNLYDGASNVVSVVTGGRVGIGTTAPGNRLDVRTSTETVAVSGLASQATGLTYGGVFTANSDDGIGAQGMGGIFGLHGQATQPGGAGVFGLGPDKGVDGASTASSGTTYGGYFQNSTAEGAAVYGGSGAGTGVHGVTNAATGIGVHGENTATTGSATGVLGEGGIYGVRAEGGLAGVNGIGIGTTGAIGVFGQSNATTGGTGILGQTGGSAGKGLWGSAYGDALYGVYGQVQSASGWAGYFTGGRSYLEGPVGIGVENPIARLMVEADADEEALRVRIGGTTRLKVDANGGVAVGINYTPPAAGLAVSGSVGIGTSTPEFTLHVNGSAGKPGGGSWSTTSDRRLKKNIRPLGPILDRLCAVESVTFEYNDPAALHELPGERTGVIAQQIEPLFPDWVDEGTDGYKRVTFRGFEAAAIAALQELRAEKDAEIARLQTRNEQAMSELRAELALLRTRVEDVEVRQVLAGPPLAGAR